MAEKGKDLATLSENQIVELFVYFLTTARVQIDDPDHYGPMRLLFAAEKLRDFVAGRTSPALQKLFEDAKKGRDLVAKKMTPAQIEKAQALAEECIRNEYKGC